MTDASRIGDRAIAWLRTPIATLKQCKQCGETKPIDEFAKSGVRHGVQQYRSKCKLCMMTDDNRERIELRNQGVKRCSQCSQVMPLHDFYDDPRKNDGKRSECKKCACEVTYAYRKTERGRIVQATAKVKYRNKPESKTIHAKYMRDARMARRWIDHERARKHVWDAVRRNGFPRPTEHVCADCGAPAQEYHHESYEREHWLDVVPLCTRCHKRRHNAISV